MKKLYLLIIITIIFGFSGCGGFRITNLPDQYREVKTDQGERVRTVTTKVKGKVVGEVVTTDRWDKKKTKTRPYRWRDRGYGYRGRYYR